MFGYDQYMPHGMCLLWEPWLVLVWAGSDLLIFIAYMAIPLALVTVMRRRADLNHRVLVALFAAFNLLCGITHLMGIVTLWYPIYPFTGAVKLATGIVSMLTAIVLFRFIPVLLKIPTPDHHEEVIARLEVTLADLSRTRDELEQRVKQRTQELNAANTRLAFTARDTVRRSRNLIEVVSSLTHPGPEVHQHPERFQRELRGRINALAIATSTLMEQGDASEVSLERVIRRQVEPIFTQPFEQLSTEGPPVEVGAQGAQQISLIAWELASRFAQIGRSEQARGRIAVSWSISNDEDGAEILALEWLETFSSEDQDALEAGIGGDGTYTPQPLSDFSETLLTRIVPRLIDGKGRVEVAPATFIYRLSCRVSTLTNSWRDAGALSSDKGAEIERELLSDV